jgi:ribosomal protein L11 methylase PrmA
MKKVSDVANIPSSFRDPSGFLFYRDGSIYRQVNTNYRDNYEHLMDSGLYKTLVDAELLVPHKEVEVEPARSDKVYNVIEPELIPFISYPYEWSFSQLKDAALTTLRIQKAALDFGMSLKDCSAYNIQFKDGKPVLIDTLSFEKYRVGQPWVAYRQFCQHFLGPLALMSHKDIRLNQLMRVHIDGIPLDLVSSLLPFRTRFIFPLLVHIHLHAKSQKYFANRSVSKNSGRMGNFSFLGIIDSLESAVNKLKWHARDTEWADYYERTNYSQEAFQNKKELVAQFLERAGSKTVWDLGANDGTFSRIAGDSGIETISFDLDPAAVEAGYLECTNRGEKHILPLLLDLNNPSPCIGWENEERMSLLRRGPADMVFALALIHHLAISNNLPFDKIAGFFSRICRSLIIEFVPKSDSQVQRLLSTREDIFPGYKQQAFENEFKRFFTIDSSAKIKGSERTLYLMYKRDTEI